VKTYLPIYTSYLFATSTWIIHCRRPSTIACLEDRQCYWLSSPLKMETERFSGTLDTCVLNYNVSRHGRSLSWYCCHLEFLRYMRVVTIFVGMIGCIVAHRCSTPWTHDAVEWGVRRPSVEGVLCCHFTPPWPKLTARTSSTSCDSSCCAQLHLSCKEGHGD